MSKTERTPVSLVELDPSRGQRGSCPGPRRAFDRRAFLQSGIGFGSIALASLLAREDIPGSPAKETTGRTSPLAPKPAHHTPTARSVIFLFMTGGPSQMETFDPKPILNELHGQPLPPSFGAVTTQRTTHQSRLLGSKRTFKRYGQSGVEVSDLFPYLSQCVDDLAIIRSCHADSVAHAPAMYQMNTGRVIMGHPSVGSWVTYGLGSESENLPAYVVMLDPRGTLTGGPPCWGAGYLPPVYQGTLFRPGPKPVLNLRGARSRPRQKRVLDLLRDLNELRSPSVGDPTLEARLSSYELAFRMQSHVPEAVDLSSESDATKSLYGLEHSVTAEFGRRCLLARRLVERGVRFVQLYHGGGPGNMTWDAHGDIEENHTRMASQSDRPIAGLLTDLRHRGLLDSTLVVWGGEFGRTPMSQGKTGRDHNPLGFTMWLAGGGVKGGCVVGATDAVGLRAIENRCHVNDLHATILHLLGLDQDELTVLHNGREEKLTDAGGRVLWEVL